MYEIAKRFTKEALERAANREYLPIRDREGACPLGNALDGRYRLPIPVDVANALIEQSDIDEWSRIVDEACSFIYDWDDGKIPNLREALGLDNGEKEEGSECL